MGVGAPLQVGRVENVVGWYHSHPGYGCWMSGIDCSTQMLNQQYQEPFLAIIIDPVRTCAAGKARAWGFGVRMHAPAHPPLPPAPTVYGARFASCFQPKTGSATNCNAALLQQPAWPVMAHS